MDPYEFEEFVADLWEARGWNARVTQGGADRGVDVIATQADPFYQKHVIQAKRYGDTNTVSSPEVQQYASLREQEDNVDAVVIVTTGEFSDQAKSVARDLNVKLVDIDDLYGFLQNGDALDVYNSYIGSQEASQPASVGTNEGADADSSDQHVPTADMENKGGTSLGNSVKYLAAGTVVMLLILVFIVGGLVVQSGSPSDGAGLASGTSTPPSTPSNGEQSTATHTPAQTTVTDTPTATTTDTPSLIDVCGPPPSGSALMLDPTPRLEEADTVWSEVSRNSFTDYDGDPLESGLVISYFTVDSTGRLELFIELYEWKNKTLAEAQTESYANDSNYQVWASYGRYSIGVQATMISGQEPLELTQRILNKSMYLISRVGEESPIGDRCASRISEHEQIKS